MEDGFVFYTEKKKWEGFLIFLMALFLLLPSSASPLSEEGLLDISFKSSFTVVLVSSSYSSSSLYLLEAIDLKV